MNRKHILHVGKILLHVFVALNKHFSRSDMAQAVSMLSRHPQMELSFTSTISFAHSFLRLLRRCRLCSHLSIYRLCPPIPLSPPIFIGPKTCLYPSARALEGDTGPEHLCVACGCRQKNPLQLTLCTPLKNTIKKPIESRRHSTIQTYDIINHVHSVYGTVTMRRHEQRTAI